MHLSDLLIRRGVRKLRLTGSDPLVPKGVMDLVAELTRHLRSRALDELTLTTHGILLARYAEELARHGVRRINVSFDMLEPERYRQITRISTLDRVLDGLDAALSAGLKVKLNAIAGRGAFEDELGDMIRFAHGPAWT